MELIIPLLSFIFSADMLVKGCVRVNSWLVGFIILWLVVVVVARTDITVSDMDIDDQLTIR